MNIEKLDLVKENLNKKLSPVTCPMCHATSGFAPYAQEFQQVSYNRNDAVLDVNNISFVKTVLCRCNSCGFIATFDLDEVLK